MVLSVKSHPRFRRDGADVLSELKLSYPQAVLGAAVEVQTLHGAESLDVPAGTPAGHQFRLRGKGIERLDRGGRGDHVVQVRLAVPRLRDLDDEHVDLLRRLAELEGTPVKERSVVGKVRDLFG